MSSVPIGLCNDLWMAFRLRTHESIAHGLRRLTRKELKKARLALKSATLPSDQAIHEARRRIKKTRAILDLIEADDGKGLDHCRKRLRAINRQLSALRDVDAMLEILAKLQQREPRLFDEHTVARLRRRLAARKEAALEAAQRENAWKLITDHLRKLGRQSRKWRPTHSGFGLIARGIRASHRRGRKALSHAQSTKDAADFHKWRKQLKALYYQLRLVQQGETSSSRDIEALHDAERWLGEEHNLVVFCAELSKSKVYADRPPFERVRRVIDRYQREMRRRAVGAVAHIYDRKSRDFVSTLRRTWNGDGTADAVAS